MQVISCKEAKAQGLLRYFTGKPCKHGHVAYRAVVNGTCMECVKLRVIKWQKNNPDKALNKYKKWVTNNPERQASNRKAWHVKRQSHVLATNRQYRKNNPVFIKHLSAWARAAKLQRTPKWLSDDDKQQIETFYAEAKQKTLDTGVEWHVDHIVPLRGKTVSGLHIPQNLQVIPATDNMSKGNKFLGA